MLNTFVNEKYIVLKIICCNYLQYKDYFNDNRNYTAVPLQKITATAHISTKKAKTTIDDLICCGCIERHSKKGRYIVTEKGWQIYDLISTFQIARPNEQMIVVVAS